MRLDVEFALAVVLLMLPTMALGTWLLVAFHTEGLRLLQQLNQQQKAHLEQEARVRANTVANFGEACRAYAHKVLSPTLARQLGSKIVLEGQSRTFVARGVFAELRQLEGMQQHSFREAALNPLNPKNLADNEESKLIRLFAGDASLREQHGLFHRKGNELFFVARPIVVEKSCLQCHGHVPDAPKEIIDRYGTKSGCGWTEGEIAGVRMVIVPAEDLLAEMADHQKEAAKYREHQDKTLKSMMFLFGGMTVVSIACIFGLFHWLVNMRLRRVTDVIKQMAEEDSHSVRIADTQRDEIGELAKAFNAMALKIEEQTAKAKESDQTQKRLVAILEASPDFVGFANPKAEIQYINRAGRAMVGIDATDDIKGLTIRDVHPAWFMWAEGAVGHGATFCFTW